MLFHGLLVIKTKMRWRSRSHCLGAASKPCTAALRQQGPSQTLSSTNTVPGNPQQEAFATEPEEMLELVWSEHNAHTYLALARDA